MSGDNMSTFITSLTTELTAANLWGAFSGVAPLIGVLVIFSLGFYIVRKLIKGAAKGKVRI